MLPRLLCRTQRIIPSSKTGLRSFHKTHTTFVSKQEGLTLFAQGKIPEASQVFVQLLNQGDPDVVAYQALCLCQKPDQKPQAEALAQKAVALAPDNPKYQIIQGHVLREVGKADLAVKNLSIIKDFWPDNWELHYCLGHGLNRNWQRFGPAILHFNTSLELNPGNADAFYWRGEAMYWLDTCNEDPFDWFSKYNTDNVRTPYYKGLQSFKEGRPDAALKYFGDATIAWKNDTSDVWSWRGEAALAAGNLDEALNHFEKALSINSSDPLSLHGKGEVFAKRGDSAKELELKTQALTIDRLYWKSDYYRVKKPAYEGTS